MEDPNMELSEIGEEDQVPEESKMSMILNRGWKLGKKIVITGVVISSAPLVLPPLMVFSTIGFAFAVPFGFVFVSYACTQKLMSKLLSRPKPPLMLEYNVDEDDEKFRGQYMDEEEKKFIDDTNETLEMRIELVGDEREGNEEEGFVVEEEDEEPVIEDMEGVREEEWRDDTRFDNYVEDEEIPVEEYLGDIEEEELKGGVEGVMGEFGDVQKIDETQEVEEKEIPREGNMDDIEVEKKPLGEVTEENRDEVNWEKVLEDEQKMVYAKENDEDEENRNLENGVKSIEEVEPVDGSVDKAIEDEKIEEENPVIEINGVVKQSRDERHAEILEEEEEKKPVQDMKMGRIGEEIEGENPLDATVESIVKGKETMKETESVVEESKDEGSLGMNIADGEIPIEEMQRIAGEIVDELNVNDVAQEENYIVIEEERPLVDIIGVAEGERRDDGKYLGNLVVKEGNLDNNEQVKPIHEITGVMEGDDGNADKSKEEEIPLEKTQRVLQEDKSHEETVKNSKETKVPEGVDRAGHEGVKPVEEMGVMMEVRRDEGNVDKVVMVEAKGVIDERRDKGIVDSMVEEEKKPIVQTEKRVRRSKLENAREIADESGLHLFDKENGDADHYTTAINEVHQDEVSPTITPYDYSLSIDMLGSQDRTKYGSAVEERPSDKLRKEIAASVVQPVSSEIAEPISSKGVPQEENTTIPSNEVLYSEEKIWEQIDAMRKIVGYKAAVQATSIEELKALYVFTGVEPPLTFKDPTDLEEINDKLRLLMSIVGVK